MPYPVGCTAPTCTFYSTFWKLQNGTLPVWKAKRMHCTNWPTISHMGTCMEHLQFHMCSSELTYNSTKARPPLNQYVYAHNPSRRQNSNRPAQNRHQQQHTCFACMLWCEAYPFITPAWVLGPKSTAMCKLAPLTLSHFLLAF